jgi:hypothetical protein
MRVDGYDRVLGYEGEQDVSGLRPNPRQSSEFSFCLIIGKLKDR